MEGGRDLLQMVGGEGKGKGGGDFRPIARTLPLTLCEEERKISLCYKLLLLKEKLLAFFGVIVASLSMPLFTKKAT